MERANEGNFLCCFQKRGIELEQKTHLIMISITYIALYITERVRQNTTNTSKSKPREINSSRKNIGLIKK
ncbi:hypothetical protein HI914_04392 [Erysiphe necator]|nr:hypothetical protein HI914_04392 [Erysiphe necator]